MAGNNVFYKSDGNINKTLAAIQCLEKFEPLNDHPTEFNRLFGVIYEFIPGNVRLNEIQCLQKKLIDFYNTISIKDNMENGLHLILTFINYKSYVIKISKNTYLESKLKTQEILHQDENFYYNEDDFNLIKKFCEEIYEEKEVQSNFRIKTLMYLLMNHGLTKNFKFYRNIVNEANMLLFTYVMSTETDMKKQILNKLIELNKKTIVLYPLDIEIDFQDFLYFELKKYDIEFIFEILSIQEDHKMLYDMVINHNIINYANNLKNTIINTYRRNTKEYTKQILNLIKKHNINLYYHIIKKIIRIYGEGDMFKEIINDINCIDSLYFECCLVSKAYFKFINIKTLIHAIENRYISMILRDKDIYRMIVNKISGLDNSKRYIDKLYENEKRSVLLYFFKVKILCDEIPKEKEYILQYIIRDKEFICKSIVDVQIDERNMDSNLKMMVNKKKECFKQLIKDFENMNNIEKIIPTFFKYNKSLFFEIIFDTSNRQITTFIFEGLNYTFKNLKKVNKSELLENLKTATFLKENNFNFDNCVLIKNLQNLKKLRAKILAPEIEKLLDYNILDTGSKVTLNVMDDEIDILQLSNSTITDGSINTTQLPRSNTSLSESSQTLTLDQRSLVMKKVHTDKNFKNTEITSKYGDETDKHKFIDINKLNREFFGILILLSSKELLRMLENELCKSKFNPFIVQKICLALQEVNKYEKGIAFYNSLMEIFFKSKNITFIATFYNYNERIKNKNIISLIGKNTTTSLLSKNNIYYIKKKSEHEIKTEYLDKLNDKSAKVNICITIRNKKCIFFFNDTKLEFNIENINKIQIGKDFVGIFKSILVFEDIKEDTNRNLAYQINNGKYSEFVENIEKKSSFHNYKSAFIRNLNPHFFSKDTLEIKFTNILYNKKASWIKDISIIELLLKNVKGNNNLVDIFRKDIKKAIISKKKK